MLRRQNKVDQRFDWPIGAQQRVGHLEQRVSPRGQAPIEVRPERGQHQQRLDAACIV
jgi:hypothetical protein